MTNNYIYPKSVQRDIEGKDYSAVICFNTADGIPDLSGRTRDQLVIYDLPAALWSSAYWRVGEDADAREARMKHHHGYTEQLKPCQGVSSAVSMPYRRLPKQ